MAKILICPSCSTDDPDDFTVAEDHTHYYAARLDLKTGTLVAGISLDIESDTGGTAYQCEHCGHSSSNPKDFIMEETDASGTE
jgi:hypothetical protein